MNELTTPARFLFWVAGIAVALGLVCSLGTLTYKMAEAAIEAQSKPMSYGDFSRQLWSTPAKK